MNDQPALKTVVALCCAYELAALTSPLPTLSTIARRLPPLHRLILCGLLSAALADHLVWRRLVR